MIDRAGVASLRAAIEKLLPISWDVEVDSHGEPAHATLTFGEHSTQAMTMDPDSWMVLNHLPALLELADRAQGMEEALDRLLATSGARGEYHALKYADAVEAAEALLSATLNQEQPSSCQK